MGEHAGGRAAFCQVLHQPSGRPTLLSEQRTGTKVDNGRAWQHGCQLVCSVTLLLLRADAHYMANRC